MDIYGHYATVSPPPIHHHHHHHPEATPRYVAPGIAPLVLNHKRAAFVEPLKQRRSPICTARYGIMMQHSEDEAAASWCFDSGDKEVEQVDILLLDWTFEKPHLDVYRIWAAVRDDAVSVRAGAPLAPKKRPETRRQRFRHVVGDRKRQ